MPRNASRQRYHALCRSETSAVAPDWPTSSYNCHMLIKKAPDVRSSEITPKDVYLRRREFLQASAAALVAAGLRVAGRVAEAQARTKLKGPIKKSPFSTDREGQSVRARHQLQQFLRVRHRQGRPAGQRPELQDHAVDAGGRGRGRQAGQVRSSRTSSSRTRSKSASIACAASRHGRW